jgi:hypothetical protein
MAEDIGKGPKISMLRIKRLFQGGSYARLMGRQRDQRVSRGANIGFLRVVERGDQRGGFFLIAVHTVLDLAAPRRQIKLQEIAGTR